MAFRAFRSLSFFVSSGFGRDLGLGLAVGTTRAGFGLTEGFGVTRLATAGGLARWVAGAGVARASVFFVALPDPPAAAMMMNSATTAMTPP